MYRVSRGVLTAALVGLMVVLASPPAFTQRDFAGPDFTGYWNQRFHEEADERGPGPAVGDYTGLPLNEGARLRADSWTASQYTQVGLLCRQHQTGEITRGPQSVTMWREIDSITRDTIAWHAQWRRTNEGDNTIWLDGRPHPPALALHSFMGFQTGGFVGDRLVATVTHMKEGFQRRNGVPRSDRQTVRQHFLRRDDILTIVTFTYDPVYFSEPMVQSSEYVLNPGQGQVSPPFPCFEAREIARDIGEVPHNLPGTNTASIDFAKKFNLPLEAVRGGAETLYPEYRTRLRELMSAQAATGGDAAR